LACHGFESAADVSVVFRDGKEVFISNPADFPDTMDPKARVAHVEEPMGEDRNCQSEMALIVPVNATIFVPNGE
jgi:GTP-binding protein LepA